MPTIKIILLIACCIYTIVANDGDSLIDNDEPEVRANVETDAKSHSSGGINVFSHSSFTSMSGGNIQILKSRNSVQPKKLVPHRIHGSKTFQDSSNDLIRKSIEQIPNTTNNNLHRSFRLPLQRLSDRQLVTLLQRYSQNGTEIDYNKMSKAEKLKRVQRLILKHSRTSGQLLIRPRLLTNIIGVNRNKEKSSTSLILDENKTIQIDNKLAQPSSNPLNIKDLDEKINLLKNDTESRDYFHSLVNLLNELKNRYEKIKELFNLKLEELNQKRKLLFNKHTKQSEMQKQITYNSEIENSKLNQSLIRENTTNSNIYSSIIIPEITTTSEIIEDKNSDESKNSSRSSSPESVFSNNIILDSSSEIISERQTYPSELITTKYKFNNLTTTLPNETMLMTFINTSDTLSTTTMKLIRMHNEINTTSTPIHSIMTTSELITEDIDKDPFVQNNNTQLNEVPINKESKIMKKILGLIQYVKNNRTKTALALPGHVIREESIDESIIPRINFNETNGMNLMKKTRTPIAKAIPKIKTNNVIHSSLINNDKDSTDITDENISAAKLEEILQQENEQLKNSRKILVLDDSTEGSSNIKLDGASMCEQVFCDFEEGTLCKWTASVDELKPSDRQYRHRIRRIREIDEQERKKQFIQRTWHNWEGRYRNRLTGIARAEIFSKTNRRFAAAYVKPNQRAILSTNVNRKKSQTILFRVWEATRDVRLRVCCESNNFINKELCVFETERGVWRGSRKWKEQIASCPKGTHKITFECVNDGAYQGACGVDNVRLLDQKCPGVTSFNGLIENRLR